MAEPPVDGAAGQDAEPDHESVARAIVLRLLTGSPKSRHQLADALAQRDVPEDVADRVLDRFTEVGLIDDAEYARILVRSQHESRGLARRGLAQELRRKGVGDEEAQAALETVDDDAEETRARELLVKRWASTSNLEPQVRTRRAVSMLARKGYSPGLAARLIRELQSAEGAEPWEPVVPDVD